MLLLFLFKKKHKTKNAKYKKYIFILAGIISAAIIINSCRKDEFFITPPPKVPKATSTLEAVFVSSPPASITSSYWKSADYLQVAIQNVSKNFLYGDGLLNMTGSYNGMGSFNSGNNPNLILKAAYDNDKLYLLAEWTDSKLDLAEASWLWHGPVDPLKTDSTNAWTSQRNNDKFSLAFEISTASSSFGTFNAVGCAASCHDNGSNFSMHPQSGEVDIWNCTLARSVPMGYAEDMIANSASLADDAGQKMFFRNNNGTTDRSGPKYEWDGTSQDIVLPNGQSATLDPAFYLLNKTLFTGDVARGDSIYHSASAPGDCVQCHGNNGEGGIATFLNSPLYNRKSRATLKSNMDNVSDMGAYWGPLSVQDKDNVVAYLRGLAGVPGYFLSTPTGSNADITTATNITPIQIKNAALPGTNIHTKYQILIIRKLKTNNADDAQFDLLQSATYKFGVALMDNDGKNHIGSKIEILTFK